MDESLMLARIRDRPAALERVLGVLRRKVVAVRGLSLGPGASGTLELLLRLDPGRTTPDRARVELGALADVLEVVDLGPVVPGATRTLAVARMAGAVEAPPGLARVLERGPGGTVVEITGAPHEVEAALATLRDAGLAFQAARTGEVAVPAPKAERAGSRDPESEESE